MSEVDPLLKDLADEYSELTIDHPHLKPVTMAQWILESARGTSELAQRHYNFGGLKWRKEMKNHAHEVQYLAHDGPDAYCRFFTLQDYLRGYWHFLKRPPYKGLENHMDDESGFIGFLGPIYCPPDSNYARKVLDLVPEARALLDVQSDAPILEEPVMLDVTGVVVLDPGHGGSAKVGGSSPNNAVSFTGILEKDMTLDLAKMIRSELKAISEQTPGSNIDVSLTRSSDRNLGLADRARVAKKKKADIFVSIHFNGFNKTARGTETIVLPTSKGNVNLADDQGLARRLQDQMMAAIRQHDSGAKDRGLKEMSLGVLRDVHLGNSASSHPTRACLIEIEFIDVKEVDELLNTGANAKAVMKDIAAAIAQGIANDLEAHVLV